MLGKPEHGWTKVTIESYAQEGSYETDIPFDALNASIYALEHNVPFTLFIDHEGSDSIICSYYTFTDIISGEEHLRFPIDFKDLIREIAGDIERYIDDWAEWFAYMTKTEELLSERKRELTEKLEKIYNLLNAD